MRGYPPKIFAEYKRRFPDFHLTLYEANQAIAEELLRKREIDLAITEMEGRPASGMQSSVLLRLPLALVAPRRVPFRTSSELLRNVRQTQSLISLRSDEVIAKQFQATLRKLGVSWIPAIEVSSLELVDLYAALGFGVGLSVVVPGLKRSNRVRVLALRKFPVLTIAALWSGDLSELSESLLADVKKIAGRLTR